MGKKTNRKMLASNRRSGEHAGARIKEAGQGASALARRLAPGLLIMAIAFGLPYTIYHGYMHAVSSPYFNVTDIDIQGAEFVPRESLLSQAQLAPGINIFDVDQARVAARLQEHPWVASAQVERKLPSRIVMTLVEHRPAAVVMDDGAFLLLDEQGAFFKVMEPQDPATQILGALPLLSGLTRPVLESEDGAALAREAIAISHLWRELGLDKEDALDHVHADPVLGISLIVGERGTEVRLGWGKWRERLERYRLVREKLRERDVEVEYILIDQDDDIDRVAVGPAQTKER